MSLTNTISSIAIFGSGRGSNARTIINCFSKDNDIRVGLIVTNSSRAGILSLAKEYNIPSLSANRDQFNNGDLLLRSLKKYCIDYIALAGFLWLIPNYLLTDYPDRIFNIHPALLPSHGGKGMYGMNIHKAVSENGDDETGITIHLVNEEYDKGEILFQKSLSIKPHEDPNVIAEKILKMEHDYYPFVIKEYIKKTRYQDT